MKVFFTSIMLFACLFTATAQEQFIVTSDSVELYVNVKGNGPACLYIHGGPGSGSYWLEKFVGPELEARFRMVYLDQRGVGRSSSPADNNYSLDRMVKDFEEVRQTLGIESWITLGHSFGGILQMGYVERNPETVSGMIFINCTLSMDDSFGNSWLPKGIELAGDSVPERCLDTTVSVFNRMLAVIPVLHQKGNMWQIFFDAPEDNQKMNATYGEFEHWNTDLSEHILEIDEYWSDFRKLTPAVSQPVLFYYGRTDWAIGPEHFRGVAFPDMILWGSDAGHMPFFGYQEDLLNAIDAYLKKFRM